MDIASIAGGLAPLIVTFGILSRIVTMNFSGMNKILLFTVLTTISTIYTYVDIRNNIRISLGVMVVLAVISILFRITRKKNIKDIDDENKPIV